MKTKEEILDDYQGYTEEEKDRKIIIELLFDIRDLLKPVEPSKPSEEVFTVMKGGMMHGMTEEEIRADERVMVTKQIEEFAHKEMKDGNLAYEKLLILLKTFYI